jgi:hypothetical protein
MLMEFLYSDANACLSLGCDQEVAILSSLSMKRLTAFTAAAESERRTSGHVQ